MVWYTVRQEGGPELKVEPRHVMDHPHNVPLSGILPPSSPQLDRKQAPDPPSPGCDEPSNFARAPSIHVSDRARSAPRDVVIPPLVFSSHARPSLAIPSSVVKLVLGALFWETVGGVPHPHQGHDHSRESLKRPFYGFRVLPCKTYPAGAISVLKSLPTCWEAVAGTKGHYYKDAWSSQEAWWWVLCGAGDQGIIGLLPAE